MTDYLNLFVSTFLTLFVILDPPGLLPVFLSLTRNMTPEGRNKAARISSAVGFGTISIFALFGQYIIAYLHISIASLRISGGLLLLLVALELLMGKGDDTSSEEGVNVAIVPMGVPLVAGPGAIVTMMLQVQQSDSIGGHLAVGAALLVAMICVFLFLRFSNRLYRLLRQSGISLASRIAGLLLSAIAVQMTADGVLGIIAQIH